MEMEQKIHFYIDDSGVLHKNAPVHQFVYAGYVFVGDIEKDNAKRKYKALNKNIHTSLNLSPDVEIKGSNACEKHKRALYNVLHNYNSISIVVDIDKLYDPILLDKKAIFKYKDYLLKHMIVQEVKKLIEDGKILKNIDTQICVNIDQQLNVNNGYYGLRESIYDELKLGICNYDYGNIQSSVLLANVDVKLKYCKSEQDYLIQASDILANRIFTSFKNNNPMLRNVIPNHNYLVP